MCGISSATPDSSVRLRVVRTMARSLQKHRHTGTQAGKGDASMNTKVAVPLLLVLASVALTHEVEIANSADPLARDPGPRATPPDAGRPLAGLSRTEAAFFTAGKDDFEEEETVAEGLGPTMNLDSCLGCHSQPASGGSSPAVNPQVAFANKM